MKYMGMPMGMWALFAGSFQKQLIAVLGYDADTAKAIQRFKTACGMSGDLSCSLTWSLTKFFDYQFTENRIESSSMPRWETNGVFFALNQTIHSTGKVSYARFHMLFGFPPVSGRESAPLVCPRCRLGLPAHNTST